MKKILFLTTNMGAGHKMAVQGVIEALDANYPGEFEYETIDVIAVLGKLVNKFAGGWYKRAVMYARIMHRIFFEVTDRTEVANYLDKKALPILRPALDKAFGQVPDLIISTFPLINLTVKKYLKEKNHDVKIVEIVTDTGDVHTAWVSDGVDYYIAPTEDTAFYLREKIQNGTEILPLGFPIRQMFYGKFDRTKTLKEYNIDPKKKVLFFFAGAWGVGQVLDYLKEIDNENEDVVIMVGCGANERLKNKLLKIKFKNQAIILGYLKEELASIYHAADLLVIKAGGATVMEAVAVKKPIIIYDVVPGQEEPNARFIEQMGFGYTEKKPAELAKKVKYLFESDDLSRIALNYKKYNLTDKVDKNIADFIKKLISKNQTSKELEPATSA